MSDYKLQFKLKQHTPIIHFQHDQHGATLRASEVKPKLDKYLIKKFKDEKIQYSEWLIDSTVPEALDYKMRIESTNVQVKEIKPNRRNQYGTFFGTIGDEYEKNPKGLSFTEDKISLTIFAAKKDLNTMIRKLIVGFFEKENFGTRQSKGFGSYTIIGEIEYGNEVQIDHNNKAYKTYFDAEINNNQYWFERFKELSDKINLLYKSIRSGINLKKKDGSDRFYFKSLIFYYAKSLNSQWEKKTIKENFFPRSTITLHNGKTLYFPNRLDEQISNRSTSDSLNYSSNNKNLFKDLLGFASSEAWLSYSENIEKKQAVRNSSDKWVSLKKDNSTFIRFKSPILFKPVLLNPTKIRIYIFLDQESLNNALSINKDFLIENSKDKFHITFPNSFSLSDFFDYFLEKANFDISTYVEKSFQREDEYKYLKEFYEQLRKNKQ